MYICIPFFEKVDYMKRPVKFFAGTNTSDLATKVANAFGSEISSSSVIQFSDGEFEPSFDETVRGTDVYLIQSTTPPSDLSLIHI